MIIYWKCFANSVLVTRETKFCLPMNWGICRSANLEVYCCPPTIKVAYKHIRSIMPTPAERSVAMNKEYDNTTASLILLPVAVKISPVPIASEGPAQARY